MKVEYKHAAGSEIAEFPLRRRNVAVYYFYTGERVDAGRYICTFCGKDTVVSTTRTLPPCHFCDSSEYELQAAAA